MPINRQRCRLPMLRYNNSKLRLSSSPSCSVSIPLRTLLFNYNLQSLMSSVLRVNARTVSPKPPLIKNATRHNWQASRNSYRLNKLKCSRP